MSACFGRLVGQWDGWLVGRSVCPNFIKRQGRNTSMLLSEQLLIGTMKIGLIPNLRTKQRLFCASVLTDRLSLLFGALVSL